MKLRELVTASCECLLPFAMIIIHCRNSWDDGWEKIVLKENAPSMHLCLNRGTDWHRAQRLSLHNKHRLLFHRWVA